MRSNSFSSVSSSSSSRAASAEPEATTQIFVKDIAGSTFAITVPESISVGNLRSLLALRTNLPEADLRIVHSGKHLTSLTAPISDYSISRESTVHLALPLRGGAPKRIRCNFKECKDRAQPIVGDCGFCAGHFCGRHRMLESHNCSGLEDCKEEEKARNRAKLENEKTVAIKGI